MASELYARVVDLALAAPAATVPDIARVMDCPRGTVISYLSAARREGIDVPRRPISRTKRSLGAVELRLATDVHQALHEAAEARECSLSRLVLRLVSHAARDGLIDAILDDGAADA